MMMNKSFAIRFVLAAMMALSVAVTGCSDDPPVGTGGSGGSGGGGTGGGGTGGGGTGGTGGMAALSVSADPAGTTFGAMGTITTDTIDVALTAAGEGSDTAVIYYTTDATEVQPPAGAGGAGGAPATSPMYDGTPINVAATTVLKFLAVVDGGAITPEQVEGYTLVPDAQTAQWAESAHGAILDEPWRHWDEDGIIGDPTRNIACAKCHSAEGFLEYAATEANANTQALPVGLDCSACHSGPAGATTYTDAATYPWLQDVLFPSGVRQDLMGDSNMCMVCHSGRESKVQVDEDIAACPIDNAECDADCTPSDGAGGAGGASGCEGLGFLNIHYYAAAATFFGTDVQSGYEYDELGAGGTIVPSYAGKNTYPPIHDGLNDCIECHMDSNPDGAHLFLPAVTSCQGGPCHGTADSFPTLDGLPMENYDAIQALLPALLDEIETYSTDVLGETVEYKADDYPYWFNVSDGGSYEFDATLLKAAYNYQTGLKDPGGYIHNGAYIQQLLHDSITDLGGTAPGTRP